jgi:Ca2+-binding EF-hand superfamily protein
VSNRSYNNDIIQGELPTSSRHEKLQREFAAIDTSGDGRITYEELRQFLNTKSNRKFDEQLL